MYTEGEAHQHNDSKQGTFGLGAEGSRHSLRFLTHIDNVQPILLEATERHKDSKADFQLGGNAEAAQGEKREGRRRETEAMVGEREGE